MLTIHAGAPGEDGAATAVAVSGDRIEAVGPRAELLARYPAARVRDWPGRLRAALVHDAPVPLAPSPRERVHALLRLGATAVSAEHVTDPALQAAVTRSGLRTPVAPLTLGLIPTARADLAVFDAEGECVVTVLAGRLVHRRA